MLHTTRAQNAESGTGVSMVVRSGLPRSFWLLITATFVTRTGFFVESFLTIFMKSEAGFSASKAAFIMTAYGIGGAAASLGSGAVIDRLGPRIPLVVAIAATGAAAGVLALGPPEWSIIIVVFAIGSVGQVIMPATNAYVAQLVPAKQQRGAFSWVFIALNSGLALGPMIGGTLAGVSFALMFAIGAALLAGGAILAALTQRSGGAAGARSEGTLTPLQGIRIIAKDRVFRNFILLNWLFMGLYLQVFVVLPLFMLEDGLSPKQYGLVMAINGAALMLMQLPVDRWLRRFQAARLFTVSALLLSAGLLMNGVASSLSWYLGAAVFWTFAELINMPLATTVTSLLSQPGLRGSYLAVHGMAFPLGISMASLLGGSAFVLLPNPKMMWLILAVLALILALLRHRIEPGLSQRLRTPEDSIRHDAAT